MSFLSTFKDGFKSILRILVDPYIYDMDYGCIRIKRKGGLDFLRQWMNSSGPEDSFITSLNLDGETVYDIGGYVGVFAVVFSKMTGTSGQVVVFEPNEENCLGIKEHIRLNQVNNIRIIQLGIGDKKSDDEILIVRNNSSATGSLDSQIQAKIIKEHNFKRIAISIDTLDGAIATYQLSKPDFIKIDIEGMEYFALLGMVDTIHKYSPQLYIEIHGADQASKLENIRRIIALIQTWGYKMWHVETRQSITINNCEIAKEGHIFCQRI